MIAHAAERTLRGAIARATALAHQEVKAGKLSGTVECPHCHCTLRFAQVQGHRTTGSCSAACGVKWTIL